jgi:hypothetical protein
MSDFTEISEVGAEQTHADGRKMEDRRADVTKLIGAFRDYANASKINLLLK